MRYISTPKGRINVYHNNYYRSESSGFCEEYQCWANFTRVKLWEFLILCNSDEPPLCIELSSHHFNGGTLTYINIDFGYKSQLYKMFRCDIVEFYEATNTMESRQLCWLKEGF